MLEWLGFVKTCTVKMLEFPGISRVSCESKCWILELFATCTVKMLEILVFLCEFNHQNAGISRILCELSGQKYSAVVLLASGPSQQTDLIGGHSKLGFFWGNRVSSARPGLEPVAAATSKIEICKKHGKLQKIIHYRILYCNFCWNDYKNKFAQNKAAVCNLKSRMVPFAPSPNHFGALSTFMPSPRHFGLQRQGELNLLTFSWGTWLRLSTSSAISSLRRCRASSAWRWMRRNSCWERPTSRAQRGNGAASMDAHDEGGFESSTRYVLLGNRTRPVYLFNISSENKSLWK